MLHPSPDTPEGGHMAVAMKAEKGSDWQGACDSKNAKVVPFSESYHQPAVCVYC